MLSAENVLQLIQSLIWLLAGVGVFIVGMNFMSDALEKSAGDGMKKLLGFPPAPIFMLLADCEGVCTVPENDAMGSVTQLMVKYLTGQCAFYLEF